MILVFLSPNPRFGRKPYFAIALIALIAVSSAAIYLNNQSSGLEEDHTIKRQVTKGFLQMTLEVKSTILVGEATKINITIRNNGNKSFWYSGYNPLAPDNKLNLEKIGEVKKYYALHYRWIELFNGIWYADVIENRVIRPMEEIAEVHYAKFLEGGEYNVTASFPFYPPYLSCSIIVNLVKAGDIIMALDQAINISSIKDVEFASLIRTESLSHPIWFLSAASYPYHQVIVDAVYGNSTKVPYSLRLSWCILEMLEYQSPDQYMHILIGANKEFTISMVEQLEVLGAKNVTVIEMLVLTEDKATALIPCDYDKIMKIAQLSFVYNLEGLTDISDG